MDSLENNGTLFNLMLVNGTMNNTEEIVKSSARMKMSIAQVFLILFSLLGMLGNATSIVALSKSKRLRSATTAFIVNLCVADFLYCLLTIINFTNPGLNRNPTFCRWFPMCRYFVGSESLHSLMAITINRYICVVHPSHYRSLYRPLYVAVMIFFTWFYSFLLAILPFFELWGQYDFDPKMVVCSALKVNGKSPITYYYATTIIYPLIAFLVCYPRIFWIVHKSSKRVNNFKATSTSPVVLNMKNTNTNEEFNGNSQGISNSSSNPFSRKQFRKELQVLKVMLVVLVAFAICYFPLCFIKLLKREDLRGFLVFSIMLVSLSNVINPIIYVVMSSEYRRAYKEFFHINVASDGNSTSSELTSSRK